MSGSLCVCVCVQAHARSIEIRRFEWRSNVVRRRPDRSLFSSVHFALNIAAVLCLWLFVVDICFIARIFRTHPIQTIKHAQLSTERRAPIRVLRLGLWRRNSSYYASAGCGWIHEKKRIHYVCSCVCVSVCPSKRWRNSKSKIDMGRKNERMNERKNK